MRYRFLSGAQDDLTSAIEHYEQASPGLGANFLNAASGLQPTFAWFEE